MIMSILAALDALLCVLVVVAALEFLRTVQLLGSRYWVSPSTWWLVVHSESCTES
ncbi:hypothetical protein ACRS9I_16215 [Pseudomonas aeruginosa]